MSKETPEQEILFTEDESDLLFFTGLSHDPSTREIINDFTPMLGETGEEFVIETAAVEDNFETPAADTVYVDDNFDVSAIVEAAEATTHAPVAAGELEGMLPELAESQLDLDLLFDTIQVQRYSEIDVQDYSKPAWMSGNTALLSSDMGAIDAIDVSAAIDDALRSLITSDES
ncbi:hypothetical protein [uncultured Sneathiella sp.]|uniref:hypothetical protein n=1 Tax=uncultured Sneathiella sp. TaxID=879315 RepID=UPI0030D96E85|tara:strand:+ start:1372 stop:1890 length:519 start_codon:yes stop_codon:yes gene_type:complete